MPMDPPTEESLAVRAAGGDDAALSELLRAVTPALRARIAPKIADAWRTVLEPDDILQVTFLEAFLDISSFSPRGPGSFLAWVTHLAENNLRDAIKGFERAKRPDPRRRVVGAGGSDESYVALIDVLSSPGGTPSRHAAGNEARRLLDGAVAQLPADYERVVRAVDLEGHAVADVASSMGRSAGAVHMIRARAHDRLKAILGSGSRFFSQGP